MQELKTMRAANGAETKRLQRGLSAERREMQSTRELRQVAEEMLETSRSIQRALEQQAREGAE